MQIKANEKQIFTIQIVIFLTFANKKVPCATTNSIQFPTYSMLWPPLGRSNYRMYEWEFLFYPVEFARKVAYEKNSKKHKLRKKSEHFLQTAAQREKPPTKSTMGKNCDAFLSFLFEALHVCSMCEEHKVKENEWKIVSYQRHTSVQQVAQRKIYFHTEK